MSGAADRKGRTMKKYKLTEETKEYYGITLYRIEALKDFGTVKAGDKGGFIRSEDNLSHDGDAWVYGDAWVGGDAWVYGNALVYGNAQVYGNARVYGDADIMQIGPIGSRNDITTFFRDQENGISVMCGCFCGTIDEFAEAVKKTHGGTKYEKEYMAAIAVARAHIEGGE